MKKIFFFSLIFNALCVFGQEQTSVSVPADGCEPVNITTDPDSYINPTDPNGDRMWDWRAEEFTVYLPSGQGGVPNTLVSPFFDQNGNVNTFYLSNAIEKDFEPEDGWELLYRKFGSMQQGVTTPYFMLYNRYTGTIRVFVNIINSGGFPYNAGGIQLTMERPQASGFPREYRREIN
jgi:hypothetical protein